MKILVLGRTLPKSGMGSKGLFEFEQTNSLLQLGKVGYLFMETSSLLSVRFIKRTNRMNGRMPIVGVYLPVKGIYKHIYEYIRYKLFIMLYNEFVQNYWKPDIIHIHYPLLTINPKIIKFIKEKNIKLVITEHWSKVMKKELKKNQINELKYLLENADAFISVSENLKTSIIEMTNKPEKEISVIPNMVPDSFFEKKSKSHIVKNKFVFTYIGSLIDTKNVDLLIHAMKIVSDEVDDVVLNIIGDGPIINRLKKMVSDKYYYKIIFHGNKGREEVQDYLSSTNAYVSASNLETFGVPFFEAMSMGVPVICSDKLGIKQYINTENGLLFKSDDHYDLSKKLLYMYENYGQYNHELIRENTRHLFSEEIISNQIAKIYNNLVSNNL